MSKSRGLAVSHPVPCFLCEPKPREATRQLMEAATTPMLSVEFGVNLEPSQGLQSPRSGWDSLP